MRRYWEGDSGISVIMVLILMLTMGVLGGVMISLVITESDSTVNKIRVTQAHYIAETGLERALRYLLKREDGSCLTCTCASINGNPSFSNIPVGTGNFSVTATFNSSSPAVTVTSSLNTTATTIPVGSTYINYGRVMVDREMMDCLDISKAPLEGCLRGADQTLPASHALGTRVGHNQCILTSTGRVNTASSKTAERVLQVAVTLQEGWAVGKSLGGGSPQNDLKGVYCISNTNCWAVGNKDGGILHWDGSSWHNNDSHGLSSTSEDLYSVWMVSATSGWAVGKTGVIYHYDGFSWHTNNHADAISPTGQELEGVSCVSNSNCWAVGNKDGGILHWDNNTWHNNDSHGLTSSTEDLISISMVSSNSGWAVGIIGLIYHYDGTSWHTNHHANSGTDKDLNGVSCLNNAGIHICWAVGMKDGGIFHWDGSSWHNNDSHGLSSTSEDLYSVWMVSATSGWAVGKIGLIYHYDGTSWHTGDSHSSSPTGEDLNGVHCGGSNDCWGVGNVGALMRWDGNSWYEFVAPNATLLRWNGSFWINLSGGLPAGINELTSVSMLSYADGWAVGRLVNGNLNVIRWDGTNWTISSGLPSPVINEDLESVFGLSATDAWTVGKKNAGIVHWNGTTWHNNDSHGLSTTAEDLRSVFMVSVNSGFAVGISGTIYHYDGNWHTNHHATTPTGNNLNSVFCLDDNNCWAVGKNGTILRYTTPTWVEEPFLPTGQELNKVFCRSLTSCWAVGIKDGGNVNILQWDGFNWVVSPGLPSPPVDEDLESVYAITANDAWAAGKNGTLLHWDGWVWGPDSQSGVVSIGQINDMEMVAPQYSLSDWREVY